MGIGLTAIALSIITSLRVTNKSKIRSEALAFARLEMERFQTNGYYDASTFALGTNIPIVRADYEGVYRVSENTNNRTKQIYLKIFYDDMNDPGATNRPSVELQGVISEALHK